MIGNLEHFLTCCKTLCSCSRECLWIVINARKFALSVPSDEHKKLVKTMLNTWHRSRKSFTLREVAYLTGLVVNLTFATQYVKHSCTSLHKIVLLNLKLNSKTVFSSSKFKHPIELLTSEMQALRTSASLNPTRLCGTPNRSSTLQKLQGLNYDS